MTGKELCQAAWAGLFDAFGTDNAGAGPLLLVSLGPQPDALENLVAPANAVCLPVMPQVDILKEGVDLFLTHGGQNSFMESLSTGAPVVVCPGFADQPVNAQKAVQLGVGLQIERPMCDLNEASQVAAKYRCDVAAALEEVRRNPEFKTKANECSVKMQSAGALTNPGHEHNWFQSSKIKHNKSSSSIFRQKGCSNWLRQQLDSSWILSGRQKGTRTTWERGVVSTFSSRVTFIKCQHGSCGALSSKVASGVPQISYSRWPNQELFAAASLAVLDRGLSPQGFAD